MLLTVLIHPCTLHISLGAYSEKVDYLLGGNLKGLDLNLFF